MKKNFTLSLLFAAALCATTACSDDENNGDNGGNGNGPGGGNVPVATMQQAQQEIDRVSKEFISKIDAEQLKPVVNLAAYCENTFFGNDGNVDVPNDVFVPDYGINGLVRMVRDAATGNFAVTASHKRIQHIYRISTIYGKWEWNETDRQWDQIEGPEKADALTYTFRHEGQTCVAKINGSGRSWKLEEKDSTGYVYNTLEVPEYITATVTEGDKELVRIVVNTTECSLDGKVLRAKTDINLANLKATGVIEDHNTEAKAHATLFSNNEQLATLSCNVNGNNLADANVISNGYFDGKNDLENGEAACNIMNSMSLNLKVDNRHAKLADAISFDGYYYYHESYRAGDDSVRIYRISSKEEARAKAVTAAQKANEYINAALYFANSSYSTPVTFSASETDHYWTEWRSEYNPQNYDKSERGEWDIEPLLNFENGTTYTFGQYFTTVRFSSLISTFNELLESIGGHN